MPPEEGQSKALSRIRLAIAIALGCAPIGLALIITLVSPWFFSALKQHRSVSLPLVAFGLLCTLGGLVVHLAAARQQSDSARFGIAIVGFFVCTLPAIATILLGPILVASWGLDTY